MAKSLTSRIGTNDYPLEPLKLDRKKLYGWSEKLALDSKGDECTIVSLYSDEAMVIPKAGLGLLLSV